MIRKYLLSLALMMLSVSALNAQSQNTLFEYPVAPDTCTTLESRCNFIVQRFWDKLDLTKPIPAENDSALAATMTDYFEIMLNANSTVGLASIRNMLFKAQANQSNFLKLVSIAEYILYLHPVSIIDDVYLTFAQAAADASWMKNDAKSYYKSQIERINASKLGAKIMNCDLYDTSGRKIKLYDVPLDTAKAVIVFFTGDGSGSSISRLRVSTDVGINTSIKLGRIKVFNIVVGDKAKQQVVADASQYPDWTLLAMPDATRKLDLRILPSVFVLDENLEIINKNLTVDELKDIFN
jgi:hypothetical protein